MLVDSKLLQTVSLKQTHMNEHKLDLLERLEIQGHTKICGNNILNKQSQYKSHIISEHIAQRTLNRLK